MSLYLNGTSNRQTIHERRENFNTEIRKNKNHEFFKRMRKANTDSKDNHPKENLVELCYQINGAYNNGEIDETYELLEKIVNSIENKDDIYTQVELILKTGVIKTFVKLLESGAIKHQIQAAYAMTDI